MRVVHSGFDGLDVAFQGNIRPDFAEQLAEAKAEAVKTKQDVPLAYNGRALLVAETGARGGYAYRCDTGSEGAIWFFKEPNPRDPWGIRVSVKSLPLAVYGFEVVTEQLKEFLCTIGVPGAFEAASIGRVDFAIDVLVPDFTLDPECFVAHSRTGRSTHREPIPVIEHGRSGRVTSVTLGKMPGRQVILYDKRAEVIARRKAWWWEIWNTALREAGMPKIDPSDASQSRVWRVELRAGKAHLKDRWAITGWQSLRERLGDLFMCAVTDIRYTAPTADLNRARWPNDRLWDLASAVVSEDLFAYSTGVSPGVVREIVRHQYEEMLTAQVTGIAATLSHIQGLDDDEADRVADFLRRRVRSAVHLDREAFFMKRARAAIRYEVR